MADDPFLRDLAIVIDHYDNPFVPADHELAEHLRDCIRTWSLAARTRDGHRAQVARDNSDAPYRGRRRRRL